MKVQEFRLLETQYDVDTFNHNELIIIGFYDYCTEEIFTPEQILDMEGEIALLVNLYNPVVLHFHNLCKSRGYEIKTAGKALHIEGRKPTNKYRFAACYASHRIDSQRTCYTCEISKPKTTTVNNIVLINSTKWFPSDFRGFNTPTDGRAKQLHAVFEYALKNNDNNLKKTLAASARQEIFLSVPGVADNQEQVQRKELVQEIRSCYASGYNYLRDNKRHPFLYYCDVNSMYIYCLSAFDYPSLMKMPVHYTKFVEPRNNELAIYHISSIVASIKPKHFPTLFSGTQIKKQMDIADSEHLNITIMKPTKGWITSVDYEMLLRDYDITSIVIDETYIYEKEPDHSRVHRASKLVRTYDYKKNAAKGTPEYDYYKMILNTLTGSLSIMHKASYSHESLIEAGTYSLVKAETHIPNIEISAFMTAYARRLITELAYKVGYDKVHCISTDAVVVEDYEELKPLLGNELGQLKMDELRNARWWRVNAYEWYDEEGNWCKKASGISDGSYNEGDDTACQPLLILDKEINKYCKIYRTIKLAESIYEE